MIGEDLGSPDTDAPDGPQLAPNASEVRMPTLSLALLNEVHAPAVESADAGDSSEGRGRAALNPVTSERVLERLAHDPDPSVRWALTQNPRTGPHLLSLLARDPTDRVRRGVASHRATCSEVLSVLVRDSCWLVRAEVATNRATPLLALRLLSADRQHAVRAAARDALLCAARSRNRLR